MECRYGDVNFSHVAARVLNVVVVVSFTARQRRAVPLAKARDAVMRALFVGARLLAAIIAVSHLPSQCSSSCWRAGSDSSSG